MKKQLAIFETGYVMVTVVVMLAIAGLALSGALLQSSIGLRSMNNMEQRSVEYLAAEASIAHAISWMRANSQKMVVPFRREELYSKIQRVASPTIGSNDTTAPKVPSQITKFGSSETILFTNDSALGSSEFPATEDITTNVAFDVESEFAAADLGDALVQVSLVEIVAKESSSDYGNPPAAAPETDFYPVYRIDAITDVDTGAHLTAMVEGNVINLFDMSFYGENYLEFRQSCDSYRSADGVYGGSNRRAKCIVGSNSSAAIHKNEEVYGVIKTNGTITAVSPYGGEACADFVAGCPNKGETCAGEDCGVPLLEQFDPWVSYCPTNQGDLTITSDTTLSVVSGNPTDNCWATVRINSGVTLTLDTTAYPYFFERLEFAHPTAVLEADPLTAGVSVELFILKVDGDSLNGNQSINADGAPSSFSIYYLGTDDLILNGTADMQVAMVAPNARVTVSGNFDYFGAILAKELELSGSGSVHYDENLGGSGPIVNIQYRMTGLQQQYR